MVVQTDHDFSLYSFLVARPPPYALSTRRSSRPRYTLCVAPGTICRNRVTNLPVNGEIYESLYCEFHACPKVENGHLCREAKAYRADCCKEHTRCSAVERGVRCGQNVKDNNARRYAYCAPFHLCLKEGCQNERTHHNGEDLNYCPSHRCQITTCREAKGPGSYCYMHTCEHESCFSPIPVGERLCERHRQCYCGRFCHIRESGGMAPFCSLHFCDAESCMRERRGGRFCEEHTCAERDCCKGSGEGGRFCRRHRCGSKYCEQGRFGGNYCGIHRCAVEGCEEEAVGDRYCALHQRCSNQGCSGRRFVSNGVAYPTCEDHHYGVCKGIESNRACGRRAANGTLFCDNHLCMNRLCSEPRLPNFPLCQNHKCADIECHRPRPSATSSFCDHHACRQTDCRRLATGRSGVCEEHTCRARGCGGKTKIGGRDETFCREHQPRRDHLGCEDERGRYVRRGGGRREMGSENPWHAWGVHPEAWD